jgi:hypothetical protein
VSAPSIPAVDHIESRIAMDVSRRALFIAPVAMLGVGLWRGVDGAVAVALALALVVANLLIAAASLGWAARTSPNLLMGVALFGFLVRLAILTAVGAGIKALGIVDFPVFCVTLVVGYLGLLFWEMRSISLSLASPGLKPGRHWE